MLGQCSYHRRGLEHIGGNLVNELVDSLVAFVVLTMVDPLHEMTYVRSSEVVDWIIHQLMEDHFVVIRKLVMHNWIGLVHASYIIHAKTNLVVYEVPKCWTFKVVKLMGTQPIKFKLNIKPQDQDVIIYQIGIRPLNQVKMASSYTGSNFQYHFSLKLLKLWFWSW